MLRTWSTAWIMRATEAHPRRARRQPERAGVRHLRWRDRHRSRQLEGHSRGPGGAGGARGRRLHLGGRRSRHPRVWVGDTWRRQLHNRGRRTHHPAAASAIDAPLRLVCDNLLSADVVTADGQLRVASPSQNADLFWGIRGGGGNFGIVTSFEFRLHPVKTLHAGPILYPLEQAAGVLRAVPRFHGGGSPGTECVLCVLDLCLRGRPFPSICTTRPCAPSCVPTRAKRPRVKP